MEPDPKLLEISGLPSDQDPGCTLTKSGRNLSPGPQGLLIPFAAACWNMLPDEARPLAG